jgi:hypothetical protein
MLISFSLFLLVYPIHFVIIAFAQEKMLGNGWTSGTPLPTPRTEVTSANLDDDVYVIGGFTSDGETSAIVEMYNATSDSWKPSGGAEQPQGTSQGGATDSSGSGGSSSNPNQEAINHINQAQSALQNGDTEGAQQYLDLAKKALTPCNPGDPHC